jgi:hypothetical protein
MTLPPTFRYFGPVPYDRCFSNVLAERPRYRAASGVRRKRGGQRVSKRRMIDPPSHRLRPPAIDGQCCQGSRTTGREGDADFRGTNFRHPQGESSCRKRGAQQARALCSSDESAIRSASISAALGQTDYGTGLAAFQARGSRRDLSAKHSRGTPGELRPRVGPRPSHRTGQDLEVSCNESGEALAVLGMRPWKR